MVIDFILDRKEGIEYDKDAFLEYVVRENECFGIFDELIFALALDKETETAVALCKYIRTQGYNTEICGYVWSVDWCNDSSLDKYYTDWYRIKIKIAELYSDYDPYGYTYAELLEQAFRTSTKDDLSGLKELADGCHENNEEIEIEALKLMAMVRHLNSLEE